jgi:hypothetical protein
MGVAKRFIGEELGSQFRQARPVPAPPMSLALEPHAKKLDDADDEHKRRNGEPGKARKQWKVVHG